MNRIIIIFLLSLSGNLLNAQTLVSQFDFYSTNLGYATVGANANGWNTTNARFYSTGGQGVYFQGSGGAVGLDLEIPRAAFETIGSITLAFDYERRESQATFFEMDYFRFHMNGGNAIVVYRLVGDVSDRTFNTGVTIPYSRAKILLKYDDATGIMEIYIDGLLQNSQNTGTTNKLLWPTSTAVAKVGTQMDGSGSSLPSMFQFQIFSGATLDETLPVELISFEAEAMKNMNLLSWVTASEFNNSHFEIERSIDGINYDYIGRVEGNGNSIVIQEYFFEDLSESTQDYYYRLKQIDFDGKSEYSKVIYVKSNKIVNIDVFPVPSRVNQNINILFNQGGYAIVYNSIGQSILQLNLNKSNSFQVNQKGIYLIAIYNRLGELIETRKVNVN